MIDLAKDENIFKQKVINKIFEYFPHTPIENSIKYEGFVGFIHPNEMPKQKKNIFPLYIYPEGESEIEVTEMALDELDCLAFFRTPKTIFIRTLEILCEHDFCYDKDEYKALIRLTLVYDI